MFATNLYKPQLFYPLPESPGYQYTNYLHCPATGHMYCLTNGCLYTPVTHQSSNMQQLEQRTDVFLENPPTLHCQQELQKTTSPKSEHETKVTQTNTLDKPARRSDPPELLTQLKIKHVPQKANKKKSKKRNKKQKVKTMQDQRPHVKPSTNLAPNDTKPADIGSKLSTSPYSNLSDKSNCTKKPQRKPAPTHKKQRKKKKHRIKHQKMNEKKETPVTRQDQQSTQKSIRYVPRKVKSPSVWSYVVPFNRRPRSKTSCYHQKRKSMWTDMCKNCILASSVHGIIHSRFAKDTGEPMPEIQLRSMLLSGDRKLVLDQQWMKSMEKEAIAKYKKIKQVSRKTVLDYNVVCHPEKPWLLGFSWWVLDRSTKDKWPLLVKCLYKYPDSKIRHASKHRSFCLRWDGISYTLKQDHAYYTQIQCLLAITDLLYAELLVHTHKETVLVPVYFDADFWNEAEIKLEMFFSKNVLPYLKKNETKVKDATRPDNIENNVEHSNDLQRPVEAHTYSDA